MSRRPNSLWRIFRAPLLIAGLSLTGLVGALLDDGLWDGLGAALLASSVIATAWARLKAARRRDGDA